ncbi:MAG: ATP-binding protein, partial [bacterium]
SDVTERKETEKQLEEKENFISALLNNLNVGVVACDAEGILTYFNKKNREFHGLPMENIPPEKWADYYDLYRMDGETRLNTENIPLYRALKGEYFHEIEMVIKPKEGNSLSILNSGQPLKDAQGNITGAVVAMHDITERKRDEYKLQKKYEELETTEEELRASNEELHKANQKLKEQKDELLQYKRAVEGVGDMIAAVDSDYKYLFVNSSFLKYHQLKEEEVIGYKAGEVLGEKIFNNNIKPYFDRSLKGELIHFDMKTEYPEYGEVNLDISYYPLEKEEGIDGVVAVIRDITERKEYEKELFNARNRAEESEALTRQNLYNIEFLADCAINFVDKRYEDDIYNFIAERIRELNPETSFVIVNEVDNDNSVIETKAFKDSNGSIGRFINNLGIQILGQQYPLDDRIEGLADGKIKKIDGGIHELSFELIPKDVAAKIEDELEIESIYGIAFILDDKIYANAFLVFPKGKEVQDIETVQAFVRQASLALNRRESEQELIRAKEKAEESDRLKSAFLANMSHEIRTPMNGIIGFSQILQESEYPKEQQKKFLNIIHSGTQHLLNIINDLVDVSKIEANQLTLNFQNFYLNDLMQEIYSVFSNELENSEKDHIQLKLHLELNYEESYIESDFNRFRQVMDNLLKNAIKYTEEGTIEFGYEHWNEGFILFYVKDSGVGIPKEQQKHIFERFRQVDDSITRNYEGTGLGLTISKNLVELLGGEMWLQSKEGEGSVFYFTFPYENISSKQSGKEKEAEQGISNKKEKTLLLIEDDPASREYMKTLLEPKGMNLISCETGSEGYKAFINHPEIDLILMDIKLPDANGLEVARKIRSSSKKKEVPIIAQSAYAMNEDIQKSMDAGCNGYISKPFDSKELLEKIGKFI